MAGGGVGVGLEVKMQGGQGEWERTMAIRKSKEMRRGQEREIQDVGEGRRREAGCRVGWWW